MKKLKNFLTLLSATGTLVASSFAQNALDQKLTRVDSAILKAAKIINLESQKKGTELNSNIAEWAKGFEIVENSDSAKTLQRELSSGRFENLIINISDQIDDSPGPELVIGRNLPGGMQNGWFVNYNDLFGKNKITEAGHFSSPIPTDNDPSSRNNTILVAAEILHQKKRDFNKKTLYQ